MDVVCLGLVQKTRDGSRLTVNGSRPSQRSRSSSQRGLTLIEILVTVAIIAVMVGISYPTFTRGLDGIRLRTSVSRAGTFFNRARQEAARSQGPVQFIVDPEKQMLSAAAIEDSWRDEFRFENGIRVVFSHPTRAFDSVSGATRP